MNRKLIVVGGGGHSKVLLDILMVSSASIIGYTETKVSAYYNNCGVRYLGDDRIIPDYNPREIFLVNGLGSITINSNRKAVYLSFADLNYEFRKVVHPSAIIGSDVQQSDGIQIMAGTVIQTSVMLGRNTIVNTRSSIDHDCVIGDHVHIAPGVTISGGVTVGNNVHIGTGATILQGISIGDNCIIGAGALVTRNVQSNSKVMGVPAREVQ